MKKLLLILISVLSIKVVHACPDLQGTYECKEIGQEKFKLSFSQKGDVYTMSSEGEQDTVLIADGVEREENGVATETGCIAQTLVSTSKESDFAEGKVWNMTTTTTISKKIKFNEPSKLFINTVEVLKSEDEEFKDSFLVTCKEVK